MSIFSSIKQLSDKDLVRKYSETKKTEIAGELFRRHSEFVLAVCLKYFQQEEKAKDAAQEVFKKLIENLPKWDVKEFKPWLYTVTKNQCLQMLRENKKEAEMEQAYQKTIDDFMEIPKELHQYKEDEIIELINSSLDHLIKEQEICIRLFYFEEKTYNEICRQTGFSYKQVKSYIQNGKRNLKLTLNKIYENA